MHSRRENCNESACVFFQKISQRGGSGINSAQGFPSIFLLFGAFLFVSGAFDADAVTVLLAAKLLRCCFRDVQLQAVRMLGMYDVPEAQQV